MVLLAACGSATGSGGSRGSGTDAADGAPTTAAAPVPAVAPSVASGTTDTTSVVGAGAAPNDTLSAEVVPGPAALTVVGPDGSVRWEAPPTAGFVSATQAAIGDGVLLASTICDGPVSVRAWDLESGTPLWSAVLPDSQAGGATLAIVDGVALVTTAGGLSAFDGRSGAPRPSTDASRVAPSNGEPTPGGPLLAVDGVTVTAPGCPTPGGY
jgi:PQQ-like domain